MGKRHFEIELRGWATIELDDAVIDVVDDEWRECLYNLFTAEDIAEHVGYNMMANNARLSMLDGWADQPDDHARFIEYPEWEILKSEEVYQESEP